VDGDNLWRSTRPARPTTPTPAAHPLPLPLPPLPPPPPPPMTTVEVVPHGSGFIGCQMTTVEVEPTIDKQLCM